MCTRPSETEMRPRRDVSMSRDREVETETTSLHCDTMSTFPYRAALSAKEVRLSVYRQNPGAPISGVVKRRLVAMQTCRCCTLLNYASTSSMPYIALAYKLNTIVTLSLHLSIRSKKPSDKVTSHVQVIKSLHNGVTATCTGCGL